MRTAQREQIRATAANDSLEGMKARLFAISAESGQLEQKIAALQRQQVLEFIATKPGDYVALAKCNGSRGQYGGGRHKEGSKKGAPIVHAVMIKRIEGAALVRQPFDYACQNFSSNSQVKAVDYATDITCPRCIKKVQRYGLIRSISIDAHTKVADLVNLPGFEFSDRFETKGNGCNKGRPTNK